MELAGRLVLHCGIVLLCIVGVRSADCTKFAEYHTLIGLMQNDRCDSADKVITSLYNLDDEHCRTDVINQLSSHFQHQVETPAYCYCNSSNRRDPIQHPEHHCYDHNADYKALFDQYFLNGTHHQCRSHHSLWQVLIRIEPGHRDCQTLLIELIAKAFSDHNMEPCRCAVAPVSSAVCHFDCGFNGRCYEDGCHCSPGYHGDRCEQVEACHINPCQNGGHCMSSDHVHFRCNCTNGYHGNLCELTHCSSFPCQNNATCIQLSSGTYYKCECPVGYSGEICEVDNCSPSPCQHGYCVHSNNTKHYVCNCNHIYTGEHCEVDLCHGCGTHGSCQWSHENKTAYCRCSPGYGGDNCEKVVDGCVHAPCRHGMKCNTTNQEPYYTCHCDHGYLGDLCEQTHCTHNPCQHGWCTPLTDGIFYRCHCRDGYSGVNCEVDHCSPSPCHHGGTCQHASHNNGNYHCLCFHGFTGRNCEVPPTTPSHSTSNTSPTTVHVTTGMHKTTTPSHATTTAIHVITGMHETTTPSHATATTIHVTTGMHETTTPILNFTNTCVKYTTVLDMAEKLVESNPMAINCTSGNHSSHEAFVLNNCGLPSPSTWKPGYNVMEFCNKIPTYTPIASFENGRYSSRDSHSGIFLGCLHDGQDGFKIAIQHCDTEARIEYVTGTDYLFNRNPFNYFTLAV